MARRPHAAQTQPQISPVCHHLRESQLALAVPSMISLGVHVFELSINPGKVTRFNILASLLE